MSRSFLLLLLPVMMGIFVLAAAVIAAPAGSHPWPDPTWGYLYTWRDYYSEGDRDVTYRACNLGLLAFRVTEAVEDWDSKLGPGMNATQMSCNSWTDLHYYGATSQELQWFCGNSQIYACFHPDDQTYDSSRSRWEVTRATVYSNGPWIGSRTVDQQRHIFAHEFGHGLGLEHHADCTVMGPANCTQLASDADVTTVVFTVYGY